MRDQWYGDHRDLVKWGVLLELARKYKCTQIMQVLYSRPSSWSHLEIDGMQIPLAEEVIQHFRSASAILKMDCQVKIELVEDEFRNRGQYLQTLLNRIKERSKESGIVFLDPDTGLEPEGNAGHQHVLNSELGTIFDALRSGDILVLYQHKTNRNNEPWIPNKMSQFKRALALECSEAKLAHAPGIVNDVVFFFALKN